MENEPKRSFSEVSIDSEFLEKIENCLKHNKFASLLFQSNKFDQAEKHFLKSFEISEEITIPFSNVLQNLGNLYAQKKDYKKALDHYLKVIETSPHNQKFDLSKTEKTSKHGQVLFSKHLNSIEAFVDAHTNISFTYLGMEMPEEAVAYCKKAIELDPNNKDAYINFGNALRQIGRREESIKLVIDLVEKEVKKRPENPLADFKLTRLNLADLKMQDIEPNEEINILTVKWGTKYDSEYVNKLYRGFTRNATRKFRFICFTDNEVGLDEHIECRKLIEEWKGWWGKASIFSKEHKLSGLKFFIDLDMVIAGSLDELFDFKSKFALLRTDEIRCEQNNKQGYNSSILIWRDDYFEPIYTQLKACYHELSKYIYR